MRPASMRLTDGVLGVPVGGALAGIGILVLTASLSSPATESFTAHLAGDSIRRGLSITRRITGFLSAATTLVSATTSAPTTTTGDPERTMSQAPNTLAAFTADQVLRVDFIPGPGSPVYVVSAEAASTEALEQAAEASMAAASTAVVSTAADFIGTELGHKHLPACGLDRMNRGRARFALARLEPILRQGCFTYPQPEPLEQARLRRACCARKMPR